MTDDTRDPFEAKLGALFEAAAPKPGDDAFADQVVRRLGRPQRRRVLILGGAGTTGSAVAGVQIETLLDAPLDQVGGYAGQALAFVGPEGLAAAAVALAVAGVAAILPRRI